MERQSKKRLHAEWRATEGRCHSSRLLVQTNWMFQSERIVAILGEKEGGGALNMTELSDSLPL